MMLDLLWQISGGILLVGGVVWGYRRWVAPHAALGIQGKGLLMLVVLTFAGGFLGSPFWWLDLAQSFAWDLPPLASRMLAVAGWSFAVVCFIALQRPTRRRIRLVLILTAVYLAPLALAIFLFHLNRFDFTAPITYGFFVIASGMMAATLWYLWRQPPTMSDDSLDSQPSSAPVKGWLAVVAALTALWGLALFLADSGPSDLIWVWPGDLLTSRLIGVMLLTIAAGSVFSLRFADASWMMLWLSLTYGLGLTLASLWGAPAGGPIKASYAVVFGAVFVGSAVVLALKKHRS
jgi:hypothetical protein